MIQSSQATVAKVKTCVQDFFKQIDGNAELIAAMKLALNELSHHAEAAAARLARVKSVAFNGRRLAIHKEFLLREAARMELAGKLRSCLEAKGGKLEDLFDTIAGSKGREKVTVEEIRAFLESSECVLDPAKIDDVFGPSVTNKPVQSKGIEAEAGGEDSDDETSDKDNAEKDDQQKAMAKAVAAAVAKIKVAESI